MTITALTPDGVAHSFPDGTDGAVITTAIKQYVASNPQSGAGATAAAAPADSSFGSDLAAGANAGMTDAGSALQGTGSVLDSAGLPGGDTARSIGSWVQNHAPAVPAGYHSRGGDTLSDLQQGNFGTAAGDLVHGLVQGAPVMGAAVGAGALATAAAPEALAGIAGAGGAALVGGVTGLGAGARLRAAQAGRTIPSTGDMAASLPRAAVDAAAYGTGLGKVVPGGVVGRMAANAVGQGAANAADQADTSVAQGRGVQIDPEQVGNAALTGAAFEGAHALPKAAGEAIKAVSDQVMSRMMPELKTPEDQQSVLRVTNEMAQRAQQAASTPSGAPPPTAIANTVKSELAANLNGLIAQGRKLGFIDGVASSEMNELVNSQARRQNNTITDGADDVDTLFSKVQSLPAPPEWRQAFQNGVRDLNTVSSQSFIKNTVGPFQAIGRFAGTWVPAVASLATGNPMEAVGAYLGHSLTGTAGGIIGAGADKMMGTNTPAITLQRMAAIRALKAAGVDPSAIGASLSPLQNASAAGDEALGVQAARQSAPVSTFGATSASDQAALDAQAEKAAALKQSQIAAGFKQNAATQQQTDAAYQQNSQPPTGISADDYIAGKVSDPSLLPAKPMSTAQELAIQSQRLANAQALAKQNAAGAKVIAQANAGQTDAMGQTALDALARRNAAVLAAAQQTPTARPDVSDGAANAASATMQKRAAALMPDDDSTTVGNPVSPIPVNTPIKAGVQVPTGAVAKLPPLKVDSAATVQNALAQADAEAAPVNATLASIQARLSQAQAAPPQMMQPRPGQPVPAQMAAPPVPNTPQVAGAPRRPLQAPVTPAAPIPAETAQAPLATPPSPVATPTRRPPGSTYIGNAFGLDHGQSVTLARAAEAAGKVPPGTADAVASSPMPVSRAILEAIKQHGTDEVGMTDISGTTNRSAPGQSNTTEQDAHGNPILNPQAYGARIGQYTAGVIGLAQRFPQHAGAIEDIGLHTKDVATKRLKVADYLASHPDAAGVFPPWLTKHGYRPT